MRVNKTAENEDIISWSWLRKMYKSSAYKKGQQNTQLKATREYEKYKNVEVMFALLAVPSTVCTVIQYIKWGH